MIFKKNYHVHVYEIGLNGKLHLYSLFNYLQDIASVHAERLGFGREALLKGNRIWVLSRIYAIITKWPVWGDDLTIATWHKGTDKLFSFRDYQITLADGAAVAAATTSWLTIDHTTRKVVRPDNTLLQHNAAGQFPNALPRNAAKLDATAADAMISPGFLVTASDLDVNRHVNNVKYLEWVADSYDLDFVLNHDPCSVEINFLAESFYSDEMVIRTSTEKDTPAVYNHAILRLKDNAEIGRIRIEWQAS
jgi:medium-chain acyl-[acyl-carrier-protein] hydrolase